MQAFKPDFAFTDLVLVGGQALADRLAIPKGIMYIPGLLEPILGHSYGSGGTLLSTVPVWMSLLPRRMVWPAFQLELLSTPLATHPHDPVRFQCLPAYIPENPPPFPLDLGSTAAVHKYLCISC